MTLEEIRKKIDAIDRQIKSLVMQRMETARDVAELKFKSGDEVYKPDREEAIIARLTADVAMELKAEYTAVIRKLIEVSRKYEYGLIYDWNPTAAEPLLSHLDADELDRYVKIRLIRPNCYGGMSSVLSIVGDYGFNMKQMTLLSENERDKTSCFELTICGNLRDTAMKKLIYQMWKEALELEVIDSYR